jgi:glycine/D-amino acid oxidase-like deaminating enzyme
MTRFHLCKDSFCLRILIVLVLSRGWTSASAFGRGWSLLGSPRRSAIDSPKLSVVEDFQYEAPFNYTCEVVGAFGRIGSFWLCHGAETEGGFLSSAAAAPRGVSPGCLTTSGRPIYVATPSDAWPQIWNQTVEDRRHDLVFVGNGLPPPHFEAATVVVPHFSVLKKCQKSSENPSEPCLQTSSISPKTFLYGKHALKTSEILNVHGVQTEITGSFSEVAEAAARKLLWASCMWLLCRESNLKAPLTVQQVHEQRSDSLDALVTELYPALVNIVGRPVDRKELDQYLRDYSMSIGEAVPSKDLAVAEIEDRNGIWLAMESDEYPQRLHRKLIKTIAGENVLTRALTQSSTSSVVATPPKIQTVADRVGLVYWGEQGITHPTMKSVVIVGGGMIGSSVALFLAQRRPDLAITVLDQLPSNSVGKTSPASWAWLNANGKSPKTYQVLNQLGIHAWKREPQLSKLVSWMGSIVRFEDPPECVSDGGYPAEGPLSLSRVLELEPLANWKLSDDDQSPKSEGYTFYFRDEGCVDPMVAVQTLRRTATKKGVRFVAEANVTSVTRDSVSKKISGVTYVSKQEKVSVAADVVVVAAGAGSGAKYLGCGLKLLHRPGTIVYATPAEKPSGRLSRILVDPFRSSHVLQRPDGSIVAGGGALEVGGAVRKEATAPINHKTNPSLLDGAKLLCPALMEGSRLAQTCEAVRPMPQDGLPVVGYVEENLYVAVTHSGMTLGPLLASIVSAEIAEGISCDLLAPFRPSRFHEA